MYEKNENMTVSILFINQQCYLIFIWKKKNRLLDREIGKKQLMKVINS